MTVVKSRNIASLVRKITEGVDDLDTKVVENLLDLLTEEVEAVSGGGNSCIEPTSFKNDVN